MEIIENIETRPYENEHACRLKDPSQYKRFARVNCDFKHDGKCIDVIYGIKTEKEFEEILKSENQDQELRAKSEVQALRYPKKVWDEKSASSHCKSKGGSFEAAKKNKEDEDLMKNANSDLFYRDFEIDERAVDVDNRKVDLSFSSELKLQRWFGIEILSHAEGAVDLSALHSMLFSHNRERIVGAVSKKRIEGGKGYARAGFDETDEGELALKRVQSRSLRGVSVGYMVYKYKKLEEGEEIQIATGKIKGTPEENPTYVATKWSPREISLTPIPADCTVGVGRELARSLEGIEIEETKNDPERIEDQIKEEVSVKMEKTYTEKELQDVLAKKEEEQKKRLQDIHNRASAVGLGELAFKLISEGRSEVEITDELFAEMAKQRGRPGDGGEDTKKSIDISSIDDELLARAFNEPSYIAL